jgi:hypothetical protein
MTEEQIYVNVFREIIELEKQYPEKETGELIEFYKSNMASDLYRRIGLTKNEGDIIDRGILIVALYLTVKRISNYII